MKENNQKIVYKQGKKMNKIWWNCKENTRHWHEYLHNKIKKMNIQESKNCCKNVKKNNEKDLLQKKKKLARDYRGHTFKKYQEKCD